MRRLFLLLGLMSIAALSLAACGGGEAPAEEPVAPAAEVPEG